MTTLNLQVGASSDDAFEFETQAPVLTGATVSVGKNIIDLTLASGHRFTGVTIAQGTTINSATLTLKASTPGGTGWLTKVRAHLVDNSPTFTTTDGDVDARPATVAGVDWDPIEWILDTSYASPEIKTVIQEIINRAGWVSGNALSILHRDDGSANNTYIPAQSFDDAAADAAKLDITTPTVAPTVPFGQHPVAVPQKREVVAY